MLTYADVCGAGSVEHGGQALTKGVRYVLALFFYAV
jgi:hypothetical protein